MKESKRHEVTDNEIKALNWTRESMVGKEMNPEELRTQLKKLGYNTNGNFLTSITSGENPPIIRVSRGKYVFNPKPIHIDRLKKVWADYAAYGNGPRNKLETKHVDYSNPNPAIEAAITLLKKHGYKIMKPELKYTEV